MKSGTALSDNEMHAKMPFLVFAPKFTSLVHAPLNLQICFLNACRYLSGKWVEKLVIESEKKKARDTFFLFVFSSRSFSLSRHAASLFDMSASARANIYCGWSPSRSHCNLVMCHLRMCISPPPIYRRPYTAINNAATTWRSRAEMITKWLEGEHSLRQYFCLSPSYTLPDIISNADSFYI